MPKTTAPVTNHAYSSAVSRTGSSSVAGGTAHVRRTASANADPATSKTGDEVLVLLGKQVERTYRRRKGATGMLQAEHAPHLHERLVDIPGIVFGGHGEEVSHDYEGCAGEQDEVLLVLPPDDQPAQHHRDDDVNSGLLKGRRRAKNYALRAGTASSVFRQSPAYRAGSRGR